MINAIQSKKYIIHLIIIIFFYLLIRLPLIDKPLGHDGVYNTKEFLKDSPVSNFFPQNKDVLYYEKSWSRDWARQLSIHPPLVSTFYYFWVRVFGDSEASLYIPTIIFGLAGLMSVYFLGILLFGSDVSFLAVLATSFSLSHIEYSTAAVHAIFELFIFAASILIFYKFIKSKDKGIFRWLFLSNICGVFIFYHYFIYLLLQTIILWIKRKILEIPKYYFFTIGLFFVLFAAIILRNVLNHRYFNDFESWIRCDFKTMIKIIIWFPMGLVGR